MLLLFQFYGNVIFYHGPLKINQIDGATLTTYIEMK